MINRPVVRLIFTGLLALLNASVYAATQPKFTIIPTTPTSLVLPVNGTASVQYTVTNQTNDTRVLTMVPIAGITQATTGVGDCANPFTLAPHQSCLLTLPLVGSQLSGNVVGGPEVCATNGPYDNTPDPYLCSQASKANSLNITRTPAEQPALSVTPAQLSLSIDGVSTGVLTITNLSTSVTATNITATLPPILQLSVTQTVGAGCSVVLPGGTCQLTFALRANPLHAPPTAFPIQGTNTQAVRAAIRVVGLDISVSPTSLSLNADATPQTITVTNHSTNTAATFISAKFNNTALVGNVTQDASACSNLASGASCDLVFSSSSGLAVTSVSVPIFGSNTTIKGAQIGVVGINTGTIATSSPLVFTVPNIGSLDVTNTSGVTVENIAANLTGTILATQLTQDASDCLSLSSGATCTLTFTPVSGATGGSAYVPVTGSNASTEAQITLNVTDQIDISVIEGSPLALLPDGSTPGYMTIKNNSTTKTAYSIAANFTDTALAGHVEATECETLAPGATCEMAYTSTGTAIVPQTSFNIVGVDDLGSQTKTTQGIISIGSYYAYISASLTSWGTTDLIVQPGPLYKCVMNPTSGALSACVVAIDESTSWYSNGIVIDAAGQYLYFAYQDGSNYRVGTYNINPTNGDLTSISYKDFDDPAPYYLALNPVTNRIYITRGNAYDLLTHCSVSAGVLSSCSTNSPGIYSGFGIAIDPTNTYAYIAGRNRSGDDPWAVLRFTFESNGNLSGKTVVMTAAGNDQPFDIAINPQGSVAYVTNINTALPNLFNCTFNGSGAFTACTNGPETGTNRASTGVAVNAAGTYAYILGGGASYGSSPYPVAQCTIDQSTGQITSCSNAGLINTEPYTYATGIALWEGATQ